MSPSSDSLIRIYNLSEWTVLNNFFNRCICFASHPTPLCFAPSPCPQHGVLKCEVNESGGAGACDLQWRVLLTVWSHTHHIWVLWTNFVQCWLVKDLDVNKSKSKQRHRISYHICHSASAWYTLSYFSMLSNPYRSTEQFGEWIIWINHTNKCFQIIYVWLERRIPTWHLSNGNYPRLSVKFMSNICWKIQQIPSLV